MMEMPAVTLGPCSMFTQDAHLSQLPTLAKRLNQEHESHPWQNPEPVTQGQLSHQGPGSPSRGTGLIRREHLHCMEPQLEQDTGGCEHTILLHAGREKLIVSPIRNKVLKCMCLTTIGVSHLNLSKCE